MYGRWTLTWALALLISAPSFSFAQDADKAAPEKSADANADAEKKKAPEANAEEESSEEATSEEKKDEATPEEAAPAETEATEAEATEEAPAVEETPAEEVKAEEAAPAPTTDVATEATEATQATTDDGKAAVDAMKKDEAKKDDASSTGATKKSAGATNADKKGDDDSSEQDKAAAARTLGAAMAVDPSKPWIINATYETTLGQAAFVKDANVGRVPLGYALILGGSYDITKLVEGTLRATARISADQALTTTAFDAGVRPRQFFLRDLNLGLSALGVYTEKVTGIRLNARANVILPTSIQSRAQDRVMTVGVGGTAIRSFPNVGPGTVILVAAETIQRNLGPRVATTDKAFCDSAARDDALQCFVGQANPSYAFFHTLNAIYNLGAFNFSVGMTLIHSIIHDISDSNFDNGQRMPTTSGIGARPGVTNLVTTTWSTVSASYVLNANWSLAAGWSTIQSPYVQSGSNSRGIRFPLWNFQDPSYSASSFFFDVSFLY